MIKNVNQGVAENILDCVANTPHKRVVPDSKRAENGSGKQAGQLFFGEADAFQRTLFRVRGKGYVSAAVSRKAASGATVQNTKPQCS